MSKRIALLFSGQGAQTVGMGQDLAQKYPVVAELFARADSILGRPLSQIAFNGPVEELTLTKNCQPALFVHGLACLAALRQEIGEFSIAAAAGLSLGEFTAHTSAGTFDFETGLRLGVKLVGHVQRKPGQGQQLAGTGHMALAGYVHKAGFDQLTFATPQRRAGLPSAFAHYGPGHR